MLPLGAVISKPFSMGAEPEENRDKEPNLKGRVMESHGGGWELSQPRRGQVGRRARLPAWAGAAHLQGPCRIQEVLCVTVHSSKPVFHSLPHRPRTPSLS